MAHTIFKNNAKTTIEAALTTTGTSITVADASLLANPGTGQKAYATLIRVLTGEKEVITYTGNDASATISGVTRDVEVTPDSDGDGTGLTFVAGDKIENRIPAGLLGEALQRQGDNGQGDNDVTGDLFWSDAAGPVILNEAATNTNPTLIPNQAELDTGWGWASDVLVAVLGGAEAWRLSTTQVLASNAAGPSLQNEAASTTNPTLIPNQAEVDTGWGWASDVIVAVLGGSEKWRLSGTQVLSSDAAGPSLQNEAATTTNPTIIPNQAEVDTGWGWASDELHAVLGGTDTASFEAAQLAIPVAAYAIDHEGATSLTVRTDSDLLVVSVDDDGGGTGVIDFAASGTDQFHIDSGQLYAANAAGPSIQNEAATTTNPTLVPNRAEEDTGWGWASDALQAIGGGTNLGQWSAAGIEVANAAGGTVLNEAASGTNPTMAPSKADLDTGMGTSGADILSLIAGGVEAVKITETGGSVSAVTLDTPGSWRTAIGHAYGKETIFIPASAMIPTASNGCAALSTVETTAERPDMNVLDFDKTSDEHAQFHVAMPKRWDEGTVTFRVFWTAAGAVTTGVAWGLQGIAVSDSDTIDVAYGTAVVVTDDAQGTAEELYVTAESEAVTVGGTPAEADMLFFRIFRDVSDGNDDLDEDARLIGVQLFWTADAGNDD